MGFLSDFRYRKISHSATVNDLLKETFRKSIHFCASLVPVMASTHYSGTVTSLSVVVCLYIFCEYRRLSGYPVPFISRITSYAARKRDEGQFVLGPVTMAIGILFSLVLFPQPVAAIGICALAFGDGVASLAGKLYGRIELPYARGKTLEGSSACFLAVLVSTGLLTGSLTVALSVALIAVLIEVLPLKDYDNLLIPLVIGVFLCMFNLVPY